LKKARGRNLNQVLEDRKARRRDRLRAVLLAGAGLALVAFFISRWYQERANPNFVDNRVVVVPLDNRTGDPSLDTLGLVASDWITRVLALYAPGREVVPTTTTLAYLRSAQLRRFDLLTRAQRLGRGTRAPLVVWGSFYRTQDSLRFSVEIMDLQSSLMVGSVPRISTSIDELMRGVDRLRSGVVGALLHTESVIHPIRRRVPELHAYQSFVNGLNDFMHGRYDLAAQRFQAASVRDTSFLPHQIWLVDALWRARRFQLADSASRGLKGFRVTRAEEARAMRAFARLRADLFNVYGWGFRLALQNPADDMATFELALSMLALNRPREARRVFHNMKPGHGMLHGRPDFYLHYAAAYHHLGNHRSELGVVRDGLLTRHRSLDVRLANCRARAALGDEQNALAALHAIGAADTDTSASVTVGEALDDCAAELDAHGLPRVAGRAQTLARAWHQRRPAARIARDTVYEKGYLQLERARRLAQQGDPAGALDLLRQALASDLPSYEPGRMMLHAEPAFRRLRNTRGFLRINQTRG
jgi:tetratricopeptide (TPR) repeat protein